MNDANSRCADVLVVGAGSAGIAAAIAAAEEGARTVLIEASGSIGGTLVQQLLEHSAGFHDPMGRVAVGGVAQRLVSAAVAIGASPGHVRDDTGYTRTRTPINHAELALVEAQMLEQVGVELWLSSPLVAVERAGASITSVAVETPEGRRTLRADVVVDCSGDARASVLAGARFHTDAADARQPVSLLFKLGNVDLNALLAHARSHREDLRPGSVVGADDSDVVNLWGFGALLRGGHAEGVLSLARSEMHVAGWPRRRELIVNVTRSRADGWGGRDRGAAYLALSRQLREFVTWFRRDVPGCAECYLAESAAQVGIRESRRVVGRSTLTLENVRGGLTVPDGIARGAFPVDLHDAIRPGLSHADPLHTAYDIPYGCLCADDLDNRLLGGRIISSTHEANGSVRITGTCFATGEAAGVAAALAARDHTPVHLLDADAVRSLLRGRRCVISEAESAAPEL